MIKVLILGGGGMLGHKTAQILSSHFDTYVTVRGNILAFRKYNIFDKNHIIGNIDALQFKSLEKAFQKVNPSVVLNCIGIIKQLSVVNNPVETMAVNSLFPHRLALLCRKNAARLIHISTDCVFSGRKGHYVENDKPDAEDLYGKSKYSGEVTNKGCLTLRTSFIGRELKSKNGLLEWFLSQNGGTVKGYTRMIFSGLTSNTLCGVIKDIINNYRELSGLYHLSGEPIDKYSLLQLIKKVYALNIKIKPDKHIVCDRSLDCTLFRKVTGFVPPAWEKMIKEVYADPIPYGS